MPGVIMVEALAQAGAVAALSLEENRGKLALFAGIDDVRFKRIVEPGDELTLACEIEAVRGPVGRGKATARVGDELAVRGTLTFATAPADRRPQRRPRLDHGPRHACARAGGDERRSGAADRHLRRVDRRPAPGSGSAASRPTTRRSPTSALPAARAALEQAGVVGRRDRPADRRHRDARHAVPLDGGAPGRPAGAADAAAYDLSAGCTGFMYGIAQAYGMVAAGSAAAPSSSARDVLSKLMNFTDRSTCVLFGDGAGAVVIEPVARGGVPRLRARRRRVGWRTFTARRAAAADHCGDRRERRSLCADERPRGLQVRHACPGQLGGGRPGEMRAVARRRRRLCSPPGQRPDHRSCAWPSSEFRRRKRS